jgi:hypothetical protein
VNVAEIPEADDWIDRWFGGKPMRWEDRELADVPICACGVAMYAPDSQAVSACFLRRKRHAETGLAPFSLR